MKTIFAERRGVKFGSFKKLDNVVEIVKGNYEY